MKGKSSRLRASKADRPSRGRADLSRLRRMTEDEIRRTSPEELRDFPKGFWKSATLVDPVPKRAISLRVDEDVLEWFKSGGPRYQTRMNAILRGHMTRSRAISGGGTPRGSKKKAR